MNDFTLTIDGKAVAADDSFGVINPSSGEVFARAPECSQAQLDRAMQYDGSKIRHILCDELWNHHTSAQRPGPRPAARRRRGGPCARRFARLGPW